eukprot:3158906-Rhodomonas_salina.3
MFWTPMICASRTCFWLGPRRRGLCGALLRHGCSQDAADSAPTRACTTPRPDAPGPGRDMRDLSTKGGLTHVCLAMGKVPALL